MQYADSIRTEEMKPVNGAERGQQKDVLHNQAVEGLAMAGRVVSFGLGLAARDEQGRRQFDSWLVQKDPVRLVNFHYFTFDSMFRRLAVASAATGEWDMALSAAAAVKPESQDRVYICIDLMGHAIHQDAFGVAVRLEPVMLDALARCPVEDMPCACGHLAEALERATGKGLAVEKLRAYQKTFAVGSDEACRTNDSEKASKCQLAARCIGEAADALENAKPEFPGNAAVELPPLSQGPYAAETAGALFVEGEEASNAFPEIVEARSLMRARRPNEALAVIESADARCPDTRHMKEAYLLVLRGEAHAAVEVAHKIRNSDLRAEAVAQLALTRWDFGGGSPVELLREASSTARHPAFLCEIASVQQRLGFEDDARATIRKAVNEATPPKDAATADALVDLALVRSKLDGPKAADEILARTRDFVRAALPEPGTVIRRSDDYYDLSKHIALTMFSMGLESDAFAWINERYKAEAECNYEEPLPYLSTLEEQVAKATCQAVKLAS